MGPARRACARARRAVRERGTADHQWVQMAISEMYMLIEAGRTVVHAAAWHGGRPTDDSKQRLMSKVFASEAAIKVCRMAMELWEEAGAVHSADRPTESVPILVEI